MREIKFRAWDKTAKQMYQVDKLGIGKYNWQQYAEGDKQPKTGKNKFYPSEVEIMQYTGLKDKNGVEIYEGDIVHYNDFSIPFGFEVTGNVVYTKECKFEIEYDDEFIKDKKTTRPLVCNEHPIFTPKKIEVIGNIHDRKV